MFNFYVHSLYLITMIDIKSCLVFHANRTLEHDKLSLLKKLKKRSLYLHADLYVTLYSKTG